MNCARVPRNNKKYAVEQQLFTPMAAPRSILSRSRSNNLFCALLDISSVGVYDIYHKAALRWPGDQRNEGGPVFERARGNSCKLLFALSISVLSPCIFYFLHRMALYGGRGGHNENQAAENDVLTNYEILPILFRFRFPAMQNLRPTLSCLVPHKYRMEMTSFRSRAADNCTFDHSEKAMTLRNVRSIRSTRNPMY